MTASALSASAAPRIRFDDPEDPASLAGRLQGAPTAALVAVASGRACPFTAVFSELASRGLSPEGVWVGFDRARALNEAALAARLSAQAAAA